MNSLKNFAVGFLALTTLGGAILAWRQYGELVELRAAAMNRDERRDAQERIADLERVNRELQDRLAAQRGGDVLGALVADASAERPRSERGERPERGGRGDGRGGPEFMRQQAAAIRELMAKPEVQALLSAQQKASIEARYGTLFKNMNLTAEQTEKLSALLAERGNTRRDIEDAARAQGINPRENPDAYRKLVTDAQNEINASIKSVIGEQGFAQLQNYEQTAPQRNLVESLQQRLATSSAPLSSAQAEQLVQILAANAPQRTATTGTGTAEPVIIERGPGFGGPPGDFVRIGPDAGRMIGGFGPGMGIGGPGGGAVVTPTAVAQAQTILAPVQLEALQKVQQTQQTQQQLQQMVRDTLAASAQTSAGTTGSGSTSTTTGGTSGTGGGTRKRPGRE